ncbi:MAG: M28 family peptidase [Thaumarchaeota archaeon]|nr:M28 family peptidase [Nitrososphaerota archaeon]
MESSERFDLESQSFQFQQYVLEDSSLIVDGLETECIPALCSASTHRGGLAGLVCRDIDEDARGKIVLLPISRIHESIAVEELAGRGAAGVLIYPNSGGMLVGRVRYPSSSIPSLMVRRPLGRKLWKDSSKKEVHVALTIRARTKKGFGRNLYATPRNGRATSLFVAHRDSRPYSPGAIDNASGTAFLLFLASTINQPRFSLLSTDAEEYGLLGAHHFVSTGSRMNSGTSVFNLDSIGSGQLHLVGRSRAGSLSAKLNARISSVAKGLSLTLPKLSTPRGSDCDVFLQEGFESCWLRSYPTPTATTTDDTVAHIRQGVIAKCCRLLERVGVSSVAVP